jgi:hypothetical protein
VKKNIVVASRKPRPPIEIGNKVIALITGTKTKKYKILVSIPNALAVR